MKKSVIEIVELLIESMTKRKYSEFIQDIRSIGMKMILNYTTVMLPKFEGNRFEYLTDNNVYILINISKSGEYVKELYISIFNDITLFSLICSSSMNYFNKLVELFNKDCRGSYPENYKIKTLIFNKDEVEIRLSYDKEYKKELTIVTVRNKKYSWDDLPRSPS